MHVKSVLGISSAHNKRGPTDLNIAQILHLSNFFELKRTSSSLYSFTITNQKSVRYSVSTTSYPGYFLLSSVLRKYPGIYLFRKPLSGQIYGRCKFAVIFRNVKRKTKGLPYDVSKIGNMCRKSRIQKNPFEISSIISSN
jgi:hypothetical protein